MENYRFEGPKEHEMKLYQTINFVESHINNLDQDTINNYNYSLGLCFRWLQLAIESRKRDIASRLNKSKIKREERLNKIEEDKQRTNDRKEASQEAADKFEVENKADIEKYNDFIAAKEAGEEPELEDDEEPIKPAFDEKYFLFNWDEDHPAIEIPPEVVDDVDNDWIIEATKKDDVIQDFIAGQQEAMAGISAATPGKK